MRKLVSLLVSLGAFTSGCRGGESRPNVIIILTDDQGYGDMSCHGNPYLKTPNMDQMSRDGVEFTQFFVGPLCQPTRCSLMTGRNKVIGRRIEPDEQTLPQMFKRGGYATAIFGKWHLGEYHPFRPADKGFDDQLVIGAGSIGQVEDYWGNKNFDPWLRDSNDEWHQYKGFCTDVIFNEAMKWMDARCGKPFFCYLSSNAAHSPYSAPDEFMKPFLAQGMSKEQAAFFGMVANLDYNLGRLRQHLEELKIADKTLVIFMTDNGSAVKPGVYNAGLRGKKGDIYEGGSRAAAFFVWPGTIGKERKIDQLAMHYDILPTMSDLLGIPLSKEPGLAPIDGISLKGLLFGGKPAYPKRYDVIYQGFWPPDQPLRQYENTSIRSQNFRLVNGNELYDERNDPGETNNVAAAYPEITVELKAAYDEWWAQNSADLPDLRVDKAYPVGGEPRRKTTMNALFYYDSIVYPRASKWYETQFFQQAGLKSLLKDEMSPEPKKEPLMGRWKIDFLSPGIYDFILRKGPETAPADLIIIRKGTAFVDIDGQRITAPVKDQTLEVKVPVTITEAGVRMVECWFEGQRADGKPSGSYFVNIIRSE